MFRFLQSVFFFFFKGGRKEIFKLTVRIHGTLDKHSFKLLDINPNNTFMSEVMTIALNRMRKENYLKR